MKRFLGLMLALSLVLCSATAMAAGKLQVEQENFHLVDIYSLYGYAFAKVSNVGDKPIEVNSALLEVFDENGDVLMTEDYGGLYAEFLQPGEYTYVRIYDRIEDATAGDVADYMLTITGKANNKEASHRLPVTTQWIPNVRDGYWTHDYMVATVTNNTEKTLFNISVVLTLLDAQGNILCIENERMYDSVGLTPGSSLTVRKDVGSGFMDYYEAKGLNPATVDAIAYVNVDVK